MVKLKLVVAVSFLSAVVPSSTTAQEPAHDGRRLTLGVDTLGVYLISDGDTTEAGFIIDELTLSKYANDSVLVRVHTTSSLFSSGVDSFVNTHRALRPLLAHGTRDGGGQQLDFTADRVTGRLWLANGQEVEVDVDLAPNIIDSGSFDLALRASELAIGKTLDMSAFVANARAVLTLDARVSGIEEVSGVDCWRVDSNFVGVPVTFWISREDRSLVRQLLVFRPDISMLIDAQPPAVVSFSQIFPKALERHGVLDAFEAQMAQREGSASFAGGAELARRGLKKLDDDYLLKRTRLLLVALSGLSEETCADWILGRATEEDYLDFLAQFDEEQLHGWADVTAAAVAAALRSDVAPEVMSEADFDAAMEMMFYMLEEDVEERLLDVVWAEDLASDSDACWAGRLMFSTTLELEPTYGAEVIRALMDL